MAFRRRRRIAVRRVRLRRRHGAGLAGVLVVVGAVVLIAALANGGGGSAPGLRTTATAPLAAASAAPATALALPVIHPHLDRLERADVVHVVDGDTIDVRLGGQEERIRYYGIDTPERGQPCFSEATERNKELVAQAVLLLPDARGRDRYGRLLRYVFDENGGSIDAELIAEGLAYAWREDGAYKDQLIALEARARSSDAGCLWSTEAP